MGDELLLLLLFDDLSVCSDGACALAANVYRGSGSLSAVEKSECMFTWLWGEGEGGRRRKSNAGPHHGKPLTSTVPTSVGARPIATAR